MLWNEMFPSLKVWCVTKQSTDIIFVFDQMKIDGLGII